MKMIKLATLLMTTTMFIAPTLAKGGKDDEAGASSSSKSQAIPIGMTFDGHVLRGLLAMNRVHDSPYLNEASQHMPFFSDEGDVSAHEGNEVIFTRLFDIETGQVHGDTGKYTFLGNLETAEQCPLYNPDALFFSDGMGGYFCTRTSQARLQQGEARTVGGFIVSYDSRHRLTPTAGASLHADILPRGVFMIDSFHTQGRTREETWRLLDNQSPDGFSRDFVVSSHLKSPSIPGIDGFFPHQTQAPSGDAGQLHQAALRMHEKVERISLPDSVQGAIYVLGPSGRGKSTLVTALGGGLLQAQKIRGGGFSLDARQPVAGIRIADTMRRGTKEPSWCLSSDQDYAIFDYPGIGDPAGGQSDIIFSYGLRTLLHKHNNLKIMMTLTEADIDHKSRYEGLVNLLNHITRVFGDDERLCKAVTLVITSHRDKDVPETLSMLLEEIEDPAHRAEVAIDDRAIALLRQIAADPNRVVLMPYPRVRGLYPTEELKQSVKRALDVVSYEQFDPSSVSLSISPDGRIKARQYSDTFSHYVKKYIAGEGNRRLLKVCKKMLLDKTYTDVDHLRGSLSTLADEIEAFYTTRVDTVPELLERLRHFVGGVLCEDSSLMSALETLSFLKDIDETISLPLTEWIETLSESVSQIRHLTTAPEVDLSNGHVLTITGSLASLSELAALYKRHAQDKTLIEVLITNKLVFNTNFHAPGISLSIHAPQWIIPKPVKINLDGNKGNKGSNGDRSGADGQPGSPGKNGGNFYGNAHYIVGLEKLTVTTHGGAGGEGGNGANGANGANGKDASLRGLLHTPHVKDINKGQIPDKRIRYDHHYQYLRRGIKGKPGQAGGKGGQGASGGGAGTIQLRGVDWVMTSKAGAKGKNGQAGKGGIGGNHGRDAEAWRWRHLKQNDEIKDEGILKKPFLKSSPGRAESGVTPGEPSAKQPAGPSVIMSIEPNERTRKFQDHLSQESAAGHVVHIFADTPRDE